MHPDDEHYLVLKFVYNNGKQTSKIEYYSNGKQKLLEQANSDANIQKKWSEDGTIQSEIIVKIIDGVKHFDETIYYENGKVLSNRKIDETNTGNIIEYHDNGEVKRSAKVISGVEDGEVITYRADGTKEFYNLYSDRIMRKGIHYNENGEILFVREFVKDRIYTQRDYEPTTQKISAEYILEDRVGFSTLHIIEQTTYNQDGSKEIVNSKEGTKAIYDTNGRILSIEGANSTTTYSYHDNGYTKISIDKDENKVASEFDTDNNLLKETTRDSSGNLTYKEFDTDNNLLKEVTKDNRGNSKYKEYDADGNLIAEGRKNEEVQEHYKYNANREIVEKIDELGNHFCYYDGNRLKSAKFKVEKKSTNTGTHSPSKDPVDRLIDKMFSGQTVSVEGKMPYIELYENGAVKTIGCYNLVGEDKSGAWYSFNNAGEAISEENNGIKTTDLSRKQRKYAEKLLVTIKNELAAVKK